MFEKKKEVLFIGWGRDLVGRVTIVAGSEGNVGDGAMFAVGEEENCGDGENLNFRGGEGTVVENGVSPKIGGGSIGGVSFGE